MDAVLAAFAVLPGLAVGSFLNVVAVRLPERRSIVFPPSACGSCANRIAWYDNVPLVSYLALRGRCRSCGARIGLIYPAVELATAGLLAGCVLAVGFWLQAAAVVLALMTVAEPRPEWAIAAVGASGFLFAVALAYPAGMGMGDVKLALLMGGALGRHVSVALFVAMLAALVPSLVLIARHGSKARKMAIPFAPFLAVGSVVALFAGGALVAAYLSLF